MSRSTVNPQPLPDSLLASIVNAELIQDGIRQTPEELAAHKDDILRMLVEHRLQRVALASIRFDVLVVALWACEEANCELLLLRNSAESVFEQANRLDFQAVVNDDYSFSFVDIDAPDTDGFAVLLTTSGTTGLPKVARHALDRLLGRIKRPKPGDEPPVWLTTYHPASFAGLQVLLSGLVGGGTIVSSSNQDVNSLAMAALKHGVTHISGTPTFWRAFLVALGSRRSQLGLRQITLGGEIADQATLDELSSAFPKAQVTHIYASTEAGALFAVHDRLAGFPAKWLVEPLGDVEMREREGILEVRSPRAMKHYLPGTGRVAMRRHGWLITNDLVKQVGDRIVFLGRVDSVINVGGAKVSPEEVEAIILSLPCVSEVRVAGRRNPITGQIVIAEVAPTEGFSAEEIRAAVIEETREKLESYKVPRLIEIVDFIDRSETGKKSRA